MSDIKQVEDKWEVKRKDWLPIGTASFLLLFLIVYLFTREPYSAAWDIGNAGTVGDALGGITAPFINLLGAILVYVSFLAQNRANKAQRLSLAAEIERTKRLEVSRQVEETLNQIANEVNSFEISFEEYNWVLHANGSMANKHSYIKNGETKAGKGTHAIELAATLLGNHKYWNTIHRNPLGRVQRYYQFNPHILNKLFLQIRYTQLLFKLTATNLASLPDYKQDPIYHRAKAFYTTKLGATLDVFCEHLKETNIAYQNDMIEFHSDHNFIHNFFGEYASDATIYGVILKQQDAFHKIIG